MKKLPNVSPAADRSNTKRRLLRRLPRHIDHGIFLIIIFCSAAIFFFSALAETFATPTPLAPPHEGCVHFEIVLRLPLDFSNILGLSLRQTRIALLSIAFLSIFAVVIVLFWFRLQFSKKKT